MLFQSLEVPQRDGGLKALLKFSSLISWPGTSSRPLASHLAVNTRTRSANDLFVSGGLMNIKWAIDAVGISISLR